MGSCSGLWADVVIDAVNMNIAARNGIKSLRIFCPFFILVFSVFVIPDRIVFAKHNTKVTAYES